MRKQSINYNAKTHDSNDPGGIGDDKHAVLPAVKRHDSANYAKRGFNQQAFPVKLVIGLNRAGEKVKAIGHNMSP